jgi:hypothetical protein
MISSHSTHIQSSHLHDFVQVQQVQTFKTLLEKELMERYTSHWYESDPIRGSAYRAIIADYVQTDPLLLKCARESGIDLSVFNALLPREVVCWVNPGIVMIRKMVNQKQTSDEVIYKRSAAAHSNNHHHQQHQQQNESSTDQRASPSSSSSSPQTTSTASFLQSIVA